MNINSVGQRCFGCGACVNICPVGAIKMISSDGGFLYPKIDKKKCVHCGKCAVACPALCSSFVPETSQPICYAAYSDDKNAMASSSGGIFGLIATWFLTNGGYVCGVAFDKDWTTKHIIISSVDDLYKLRGSKYVQSDTNKVYTDIKKLLDLGKRVLFSGTPCQVAGLYGFLGRDYKELLTCDVFCHGVPSPAVWKQYLQETSKDKKITSINFRDKSNVTKNSTCPYNVTFCFESGEKIIRPYTDNSYMNGFLKNLYLRKSCAGCKFAKTPRTSDVSLGDFWRYDNIDKKRDTSRGLSAVLLNTEKGKKIFEEIKKDIEFIKPVNLQDIILGNKVLVRPLITHKNRESFMNEFKSPSGKNISEKINNNLADKDVAIMNFSSFSSENYGGSLVGYALEQAIKKLGYKPSTVSFIPSHALYKVSINNPFMDFYHKFMNGTGICTTKDELRNNINGSFNKFIIGSDQVLRHPWHQNFAYYLDWVRGDKTMISYAASFGTSELHMNNKEKRYAKKCLKRFDALSIREESGADIIEKELGMNRPAVLCDPTMLLEGEDYQKIIDEAGKINTDKEYVAYYLLDASTKVLSEIGKRYQLIDAYRDDQGKFREVGQWLNIIKNAKYVITDSFHGTVFSLIFKKQFITLTTENRGNERLNTLMTSVGLSKSRLVDRNVIVLESKHFKLDIDYKKIDKNIFSLRNQGYDFLQKALVLSPKHKHNILKNKVFKLFGLLPIFSIKNNRCYVFGVIRIGNIN